MTMEYRYDKSEDYQAALSSLKSDIRYLADECSVAITAIGKLCANDKRFALEVLQGRRPRMSTILAASDRIADLLPPWT